MKKQIRRSVYETNSSSTHSVSIYNNKDRKFEDIPKNSKVVLDDSYTYGTDIFDELGKLNYIVTMLASIAEEKVYDDELEINSFESMINISWFVWLAEVIKEESNTEVIYKNPTYRDGEKFKAFPYYDTTSDENNTIESIFCAGDLDTLNNEWKFKNMVKHIIYDPSVIIEDKENEY